MAEEVAAKRPRLRFFDPHFHVWDISSSGPHRADVLFPVNGDPCYSVKGYEKDLVGSQELGVDHDGGVFVEAIAKDAAEEFRWTAKDLATSGKGYLIAPHANLEDPAVGQLLGEMAAHPDVRSIRQILNWEPTWPCMRVDVLGTAEFECGYALLAQYGLSFDLQLNPHQYAKALEVVARHPEIPVIINHLGTPTLDDLSGEKLKVYRDGMGAFAALPNVYLKISYLCYIDADWDKKPEVLAIIHEMICLFGISRCMFASNYPVDNHKDGWGCARLIKAFLDLSSRYGERAQQELFAGTAERAYRRRRGTPVLGVPPPMSLCCGRPGVRGEGCVVTGGAAGIGRGLAEVMALIGGAKVIIGDRDAVKGEATARAIREKGGYCVFKQCDVTSEENVKALMQSAKAEFGSLRILINNAVRFMFGHLRGSGQGSKTGTDRDISDEDWDIAMRTNVRGYAWCIKHALPFMRENPLSHTQYWNDQGEGVQHIHAGSRGSVVNIASVSSFIAQPEFVPYNCSKGAVLQLTKCCAMDLAAEQVRVNAVCPGSVDTPGSYGHMRALGLSIPDGKRTFADSNLQERQAAPEEIGSAALFLASDDASFVTGAHLVVDAGTTIGAIEKKRKVEETGS